MSRDAESGESPDAGPEGRPVARGSADALAGSIGLVAQDEVPRAVLDSLMEGCQVIGPDWRYLYVNDTVAAQAKSTREGLLGRTMMECFPGIEHTEMFDRLRRCMQDRARSVMENEFRFPDGSLGWFELHFEPVPVGVAILSMDITERRRAELRAHELNRRLENAERLEALGRLAAGVAHDFNNLLGVIGSSADYALEVLEPEHAVRREIDRIRSATKSASALTSRLLAFGRGQELQPVALDVGELVEGVAAMLYRLLGRGVELSTRIDASAVVDADPIRMQQVLVNLALNARDAMPEGGTLVFSCDVRELGLQTEPDALPRGRYAVVSVSDSGTGIAPEDLPRLFEPFFTTKAPGRGTGLGLSSAYGTVTQSGGVIRVSSELGTGTTFEIWLPLSDRAPMPIPVSPLRPSSAGVGVAEQRILVVEDNDAVRELVERTLRRAGYGVTTAADGVDALELACSAEPAFDLVVTDVSMPRMDGIELVAALSARGIASRVLYMTGHTDDPIFGQSRPGTFAIAKPFGNAQLAQKVAQVLAEE